MDEQGLLNYVKKVIHSLIVSTPLNVNVERLKRDYMSEEGSAPPFHKLGYKDFESFLRSIPDTVVVIGYGPMAEVLAKTNEKTAHIENLVKCQKKPQRKAQYRQLRSTYPSQRSDLVFVNERQNLNRLFNNNNHNYGNGRPQYAGYRNNNYNAKPTMQLYRPPAVHQAPSVTSSFAKFTIANVDESSSDDLKNIEVCVPDKDPIEKPTETKSESPIQLDNNANKLDTKPIAKYHTEYVSSGEGSDKDALPAFAVDEQVLNYKYTKKHPVAPEVKEPKKELHDEYLSSDGGSDTDAIPAYAVDERVLSIEYPLDAVNFDYRLPVRNIYEKLKLNDRIQVQLVAVASPHSFYFWIYDEDYEKYKNMSNNMQRCYNNIDDKRYTIPLCLIMPGHLAAIHSRGIIWQRVSVLNIYSGNQKNIEVEHIDTGERMWVCHSDLKYLCKEFAQLPAQRFYGRLACVMPRQGAHFSADASNCFYDLVSYRRLFAKIEKIDDENNAIRMILVDPDASSKNINIALIESGLVRRCYKP